MGGWAGILDPDPSWTFRNLDTKGKLSASRIDLVLANHAAMAMVRGTEVLVAVQDGGYSPVVVDLAVSGPSIISWLRPTPKVPTLLRLSSPDLSSDPAWQDLMAQWTVSPVAQALLSPDALALTSLSVSINRALLLVVDLPGGWIT